VCNGSEWTWPAGAPLALAIGAAGGALLASACVLERTVLRQVNRIRRRRSRERHGRGGVRDHYVPPPGLRRRSLGLPMADVEDTTCATRGGTLAKVVDADGWAAGDAHRWSIAGARRAQDTFDGAGIVVLDADGKNPDDTRQRRSRTGADRGRWAKRSSSVDRGLHDVSSRAASMRPVTGPAAVELATEGRRDDRHRRRGDTEALVAWTTSDGRVRARRIRGRRAEGRTSSTSAPRREDHERIDLGPRTQVAASSPLRSPGRARIDRQNAFGRAKDGARYKSSRMPFGNGPVARRTISLAKVPSGLRDASSRRTTSRPMPFSREARRRAVFLFASGR